MAVVKHIDFIKILDIILKIQKNSKILKAYSDHAETFA